VMGIERALPFWVLVMTRFLDACLRNDLTESTGLVLYQPLPPAQRAVTQTMNDGIFVPLATGLSGLFLLLLKKGFHFGPLEICYAIPFFIIPWVLSGFSVTRRYPSMVAAAIAGHRFDSVNLSLSDSTSLSMLKSRLTSPHSTEVLYALTLLDGVADLNSLSDEMRRLLTHSEADIRREAVKIIARQGVQGLIPSLRKTVENDESMLVRAEALIALAKLEETEALDELTAYLSHSDPELRVAAIVGLMKYVGLEGIVLAAHHFDEMRSSTDPSERRLAAKILGDVGIQNFYRPLLPLLTDEKLEVRNEALISAGKLKNPRIWPLVIEALDIPGLQSAAISSLVAGAKRFCRF